MPLPKLYQTEFVRMPQESRVFWLQTTDKIRLRVNHVKSSGQGTVFILPGRSEFIEKFHNVICGFKERGFDTLTIDWRGQGMSDRLLPNRRKGYIDRFSSYHQDFADLMAYAKSQNLPRPYILYGHSMGGLFAARYLRDYKDDLTAGILIAPMLRLGLGPIVRFLNIFIPKLQILLGRGESFAFKCDYRNTYERDFEGNLLTQNHERFEELAELMRLAPDLVVGGPTWRWVGETNQEMKRVRKAPASSLPFITIIGCNDKVVSNSTARHYTNQASCGAYAEIANSLHEPMQECDEIRQTTWQAIDDFLLKTLSP